MQKSKSPNPLKKPRLTLILLLIILVGLLLSKDGFRISMDGIRISRNFHEVEKNQVYRSAQLTGSELETVITQYGLKTIINLQGERPGYLWYDAEKAMAQKHNVKLINLPMATESVPQKDHLISLLDAFRDAPRPLLIHCRAGSDRTGEAAAIYLLDHQSASHKEALKMLSARYLYIEPFAPAKKYFVEKYQGEKWARNTYDPCSQEFRYVNHKHCPTPQRTPSAH